MTNNQIIKLAEMVEKETGLKSYNVKSNTTTSCYIQVEEDDYNN